MPPHLQSNVSPPRGSTHRQSHAGMLPPRGDSKTPPRLFASSRNPHPLHHQPDLRSAYKAQSKFSGGGVNGQNNNQNSPHHQLLQKTQSDDQRSMSSMSAANSGAAPSSVYMPSIPLTRDVSDLSGISGGTSRGSKTGSVPGQILDPDALTGPWRQAYNLSNVPPEVSNPDMQSRNGDTGRNDLGGPQMANSQPSIWVPQNDVVEIFDNLQSSLGLDRFQMQGHNRIPVLILLMDPSRQTYELMQIWVDRTIDSIRDLVHALQHKLPDKWKQAYDGIFQARGHRFTQLINIIRLVKYDIQPHEILVAKPWSMPAKMTWVQCFLVSNELREGTSSTMFWLFLLTLSRNIQNCVCGKRDSSLDNCWGHQQIRWDWRGERPFRETDLAPEAGGGASHIEQASTG